MKKNYVIIGLILILFIFLIYQTLNAQLQSLSIVENPSYTLSEDQILNTQAETICFIKQIYKMPVGDSRYKNALEGSMMLGKNSNFLNFSNLKYVYTSESSCDNKIPLNIGKFTYMLIMHKTTDQITLDEMKNPIIGISSKLRFDSEEWVNFFGQKYRGGGVEIIKGGFKFFKGTEKKDNGKLFSFNGKDWILIKK